MSKTWRRPLIQFRIRDVLILTAVVACFLASARFSPALPMYGVAMGLAVAAVWLRDAVERIEDRRTVIKRVVKLLIKSMLIMAGIIAVVATFLLVLELKN